MWYKKEKLKKWKVIYSIILALSFCFMQKGSSAFADFRIDGCEQRIGDVNFDRSINIIDAVSLVSYIMGSVSVDSDDCSFKAADLNSNGSLDILDVISLLNMSLLGEDCNTKDSDCDGLLAPEEGQLATLGEDCDDHDFSNGEPERRYEDLDGDGFGNPEVSKLVCKQAVEECSINVYEYHDIAGTSLSGLFDSLKFPDAPDVSACAPYFEWPQTGDINTLPPGHVRDNYGWQMEAYIHPPESGEYIFAVAADDNSELWLSTDSDPDNVVLIAKESQWQGVRNFQAEGDESVSSPVSLEAGEAYYIKAIAKEGGGGDNLAVAWSLPSDGLEKISNASLPISGDYLSPFVSKYYIDSDFVEDSTDSNDNDYDNDGDKTENDCDDQDDTIYNEAP